MFIRLLGPVGVGDGDGEATPVAGQVGAAVLARLALADGRWLSSDALVAWVWDEAPASSRNAVQVAVSRLRKQFGVGLVQSGRHGYAVDRTRVRVDWHEAEALVAAARDRLEAGDADSAAETTQAAIELFRGEPLIGLTSAAAEAARRRADDLRHAARLLLSRALLGQGRPGSWCSTTSRTRQTFVVGGLRPFAADSSWRPRCGGTPSSPAKDVSSSTWAPTA